MDIINKYASLLEDEENDDNELNEDNLCSICCNELSKNFQELKNPSYKRTIGVGIKSLGHLSKKFWGLKVEGSGKNRGRRAVKVLAGDSS